jgi:hypothetical protein
LLASVKLNSTCAVLGIETREARAGELMSDFGSVFNQKAIDSGSKKSLMESNGAEHPCQSADSKQLPGKQRNPDKTFFTVRNALKIAVRNENTSERLCNYAVCDVA